ncbi:MAG: ethylbenzene dehydrogenase-related protein [Candidatus Methylomirabilales bacterium]
MKRKMWLSLGSLLATLALVVPSLAQEALVSKFISGNIPLDPQSKAWRQAKPLEVTLAGQNITTPMNLDPSVKSITVKSLTNKKEIAFLLVWKDATENRFHSVGDFSDAVAVQIPYTPSDEVPYIMGGPGKRVLILHWAAFRQENIDHGYYDTAKAKPNYTYDWYPHAKAPYKYPVDWHNPYALNYIGGEKVFRKNTIKTPVREVIAEGFGSSTWKDIQGAEGKGVHKNGQWSVVLKRRFVEENTSNPQWGKGQSTFITFAVWDGAKNERGARKSLRHGWIPLRIGSK